MTAPQPNHETSNTASDNGITSSYEVGGSSHHSIGKTNNSHGNTPSNNRQENSTTAVGWRAFVDKINGAPNEPSTMDKVKSHMQKLEGNLLNRPEKLKEAEETLGSR
ncbi:hypothetical protein NEOLI_003060 [Neolecta irregularis DAH-3]|uniref:Uncharacterized protein n=1 Tax=Neolecta irregularis (strain DAH-3) TaxID=1198029 RepID=A0A1U7LPK0_NEOID|nr:hypothetical protein NEOLI_003060 [Neolecta irregularis DAH-3]|eukprot:OLL24600.1 hypothetical protein NEOLI_003060 [Neolecta irregularis DAH-3]